MGLLQLVLILVVIGVALGLLNRYGPAWFSLDGTILRIINIVVVVAVVIWLMALFGLFDYLNAVHVGRRV